MSVDKPVRHGSRMKATARIVVVAASLLVIVGIAIWGVPVYDFLFGKVAGEVTIPLCAYIDSCDIKKTTTNGVAYEVNNSVARFSLDVARDDRHCAILFSNYAAAMGYCRAAGLPVIPSVNVIQGKCKQFDDRLCAALEAAMQHGLPGDARLSKRASLLQLLNHLVELRTSITGQVQTDVADAIVHVATALTLGGQAPSLDASLASRVRADADAFLGRPDLARPIGF